MGKNGERGGKGMKAASGYLIQEKLFTRDFCNYFMRVAMIQACAAVAKSWVARAKPWVAIAMLLWA
jgi:hypothetical protein